MEKNSTENEETFKSISISTSINVDLGLFSVEEKFSTDLKSSSSSSTLIDFNYDEENNLYLFYSDDNKITYLNESQNFKKIFEGFYKNKLTHLSFITENNSSALVLLFERGDLFIIPSNFIEGDFFDEQWAKIVESTKLSFASNSLDETGSGSNSIHSQNTLNTTNTTQEPSLILENKYLKNLENLVKNSYKLKNDGQHLNLSDLLICSRKKSNNGDHFNLKIFRPNNLQIFYRNIFNSYFNRNSSSSSSSPLLNKETFTGNTLNTSVIHWNSLSGDYLIMNVEYNLLLLNLNSLECIVIKFNYLTRNLILCDYNQKLQYLIIETESDYFSLTLFDKENDININCQDKSEIIPTKIKFKSDSVVTIQNYNGEDVVCNFSYGYIFEIYHLFELNNSIFTFDFRNLSGIDIINYQIINCFVYQKVLLLILKNNTSESTFIKAVSHSHSFNPRQGQTLKNIKSQKDSESCETRETQAGKIWCNQNYSLLNDYVLFTKQISLTKINKIMYSKNLVNFYKNNFAFPISLGSSSEKSNSADKNNLKILKKFKDKIKFYKNDKNLSKNANDVIFYVLAENSLIWFEFKSSMLNYSNSNKFKNHQNNPNNQNNQNNQNNPNNPSPSLNQDFLFNQLTSIKDSNIYSYTFLRKLELLNYCLKDKLFENLEEILDRITKVAEHKHKCRGFILKLIWSYTWKTEYNTRIKEIVAKYIHEINEIHEVKKSTDKDKVDINIDNNRVSDFTFLIEKFIEFSMFNLVEQSKINLENFLLLVYLYIIKSEIKMKKDIFDMIDTIDSSKINEIVNNFRNQKKLCDFFNKINLKQEDKFISNFNKHVLKNGEHGEQGEHNKNHQISNQISISQPDQKNESEADRFSISSLDKLDVSGELSLSLRDEPFHINDKTKPNSIPCLRKSMAMSNFNIKNSFYNVLKIPDSRETTLEITEIIEYSSLILDGCCSTSNISLFMKMFISFSFSSSCSNPSISSNENQKEFIEKKNNLYNVFNVYNVYNDSKSCSERKLNKKFSNKIIKRILAQNKKCLQIKFLIASLITETSNLSEKLIEEIFINKYKNLSHEEIIDISNFLVNLFKKNLVIHHDKCKVGSNHSDFSDLKFFINLDEILYLNLNDNLDLLKKCNNSKNYPSKDEIMADLKNLKIITSAIIKKSNIFNNSLSLLNHLLKILEINNKYLNQYEQDAFVGNKNTSIINFEYIKSHKENINILLHNRCNDEININKNSNMAHENYKNNKNNENDKNNENNILFPNPLSFKDKKTLELIQKNIRKFNT